jgi:hypothetical protein
MIDHPIDPAVEAVRRPVRDSAIEIAAPPKGGLTRKSISDDNLAQRK